MNRLARFLQVLALLSAASSVAAAQPVIFTALNGVSSSALLSPGSWVSIYGANLAPAAQTAQSGTLPATLGGVSVTVGGLTASLRYVSPSQVNALIPSDVAIPTSTVVPLVVSSTIGSDTYNIRLTRDAPAIFTQDGSGLGLALLYDARFNPVATVHPSDILILYAAGLGPVNTGHLTDPVDVYLGERKAQLLSAGPAPGFPGVYQLNVIAPALATDRIFLRSGGWQSNIVYMTIQQGTNTRNATGSIDGLLPSSDPGYPRISCTENFLAACGAESFSIMLHAAAFTASFDIAPSAGPFDVATVGEAGSVILSINPAAGTYTAIVSTLTDPAKAGDFQNSVTTLWDYSSCNPSTGVCVPFPGNELPPSRIPPFWLRAIQSLPTANATGAPPNALYQTSGTFVGSHFAIDAQNNTVLSKFGGIVQVPLGPFNLLNSTFSLYIDGKLVSLKSLPYVPVYRCLFTGSFCWSIPGPVVSPPQLDGGL